MTTYGITSEGFSRKPESAIVAGIEARQRATMSDDLDVSSESIIGQNNGIVGREIGICWELLEVLSRSTDPDQAEGDLLEQVSKLTGTERRGASYSLVPLSCGLNAGTTIQAGVAYAAVNGDPSRLWTPLVDFTAPSSGTHVVLFRAESTGPVVGLAGTITVIHSPVGGWNSVTNAADAALGRPVDTNAVLRLRREQQLANAGSATTRAIAAALLEIPEIISVKVFENLTDTTDADGLPPHSLEVMVFDGLTPLVPDTTIAQLILDNKAGGIRTYGAVSADATDADGQVRSIRFSRPNRREVYIELSRTVVTGYAGDTALKGHIVSRAQETYGLGQTVRSREIDSFAFEVQGMDDVTSFKLGFAASPTNTSNLAIGTREVADFDTSRIAIV